MLLHKHPNTSPAPYLFPGTDQTEKRNTAARQTELSAIRFVQKLGIRPHLTGYHLLVSTIRLALDEPELHRSLTRSLYPAVARLHRCGVSSVERNIRKAIESAYESDPERIHAVFYFKVKKPYISEVISTALETIRLETAPSPYEAEAAAYALDAGSAVSFSGCRHSRRKSSDAALPDTVS